MAHHTLRASLGLLLGSSLLVMAASAETAAATEQSVQAQNLTGLSAKVDSLLKREDMRVYRGWLKFLRLEAQTAELRSGSASKAAEETRVRLAEWLSRIEADPGLLAKLRGVQEWAYESEADGSGQPFHFSIPSDYDPHRDYPLSVYMHGYSGNHMEHSTDMKSREGYFDVAVLGRSRGGGYRTLSEADVLGVVDYLQSNWPIDPDRIHLSGGSMGGGGTFRLGARYPHRWASGRPVCGFATFVPFGNLTTLPLYATHSADDPTVSILHARWPMARLRELGGEAIFDETNGLGHAAWDYIEGSRRADQWYRTKSRPRSQDVRHIDYTATDGLATRGWWAEVVEWGDLAGNARFVANAGTGFLGLELSNVKRLKLRLSESPFESAVSLKISVNGAVPLEVPAPLPAELVLVHGTKGWALEKAAEALPFRLHAPGGPSLLYDGEPLLIVYGTGGTEPERKAMLAAAQAASKSPNPQWLDDSGEAGKDGVPHSQNLYGHLNIKADTEVQEADIARCHLVLIGTAAQNSLVARMADKLPVSIDAKGVKCSDGEHYIGGDLVLGLVHYNPLAPGRLVYWVAGDNPSVYAANSFVPGLMGGTTFRAPAPGFDFMVAKTGAPVLVATRRFGSRWDWVPRVGTSRLLPKSLVNYGDLEREEALAVRKSAGADLCLLGLGTPAEWPAVVPGVTRASDLAQVAQTNPVCRFEIEGVELLDAMERVRASQVPESLKPRLYPADLASRIDARKTYTVALPGDMLGAMSGMLKLAPESYRILDLNVGQAIEESLGEGQ